VSKGPGVYDSVIKRAEIKISIPNRKKSCPFFENTSENEIKKSAGAIMLRLIRPTSVSDGYG